MHQERKKLIELQTTAHLLNLIQDMKLRKIETPANLKFSEKIKNFAFISNGNAFTNGAIKESIHGYPLNFKFDSFFYKNYHVKYILQGTKVTFDTVKSPFKQYENIVCMNDFLGEQFSLPSSCI